MCGHNLKGHPLDAVATSTEKGGVIMDKNVLEGYTCLECKHYRSKERKYDNQRRTIIIPQHCVLHPKLFLEWWERNIECIYNAIGADGCNNFKKLSELTDIVDKMHRNLCVEIADKMVERTFPIKKGEQLDKAFEPDYKLKKDIECKLNGFAAAVLDAECCTKEIVDFWLERICDAAHKYIKQLKIDWDKLSKEQQDEFLKRLIMPNYDSPFKPPFNPTCDTTNTNKED